MKNNFITEISEEDFRKLDLIGYRNTRVNCDEHSYRMIMAPVHLNEILDKELELSEEPVENVVFAIHIEPTEEAIKEHMRFFTSDGKGGRRNYTYDEAKELALFDFSYLDKFMNRFSGNQTFQVGTNMPHIYSNRDYYYIKDDYWRVKKSETKAMYIVHVNQKLKSDLKEAIKDPAIEKVDCYSVDWNEVLEKGNEAKIEYTPYSRDEIKDIK